MATRVRPNAKDIPIGCTVAPANTAVPSPAKINTNVPNSSAVYFIDVPLHQKSSRECRHSTTPFFVSRSKVAQLRQNTRDVKERANPICRKTLDILRISFREMKKQGLRSFICGSAGRSSDRSDYTGAGASRLMNLRAETTMYPLQCRARVVPHGC